MSSITVAPNFFAFQPPRKSGLPDTILRVDYLDNWNSFVHCEKRRQAAGEREVEMEGRKEGYDNEDGPCDTKNEWKLKENEGSKQNPQSVVPSHVS